jgi:hypothetical protein
MNSLIKPGSATQPTGGDPFKTDQIGSSNARLANMQKALAGGRKKSMRRNSKKGGAAPGALPNGGTVVAQYPGDNSANPLLVKMAALEQQADANRALDGNIPPVKGGGRIKTRKTRRKSHKKRRQYKKKTRRRYKY